ncbi:MAG TPA: hypothetical protein VIK86_07840 [Candidatus Paceibacterota bacterium]
MKYIIGKEIEYCVAWKEFKQQVTGNEFILADYPELKLGIRKMGRNYNITELTTGTKIMDEFKSYISAELDRLIPKAIECIESDRYKSLVDRFNSIPFEEDYLKVKKYLDMGFNNRSDYLQDLSRVYEVPIDIVNAIAEIKEKHDDIVELLKMYNPVYDNRVDVAF